METKDFSLKIKSIEDSGEITAHAAIYGVEDLQRDVIEKGAFTRAISQQGSGIPFLWSHRQDMPIGTATLQDSDRGPLMKGMIDLEDPDGQRAHQRAKRGIVKGVSICFDIPNQDSITWKGPVRHIHEVRMHEISLVAIPAQPGARILSVKSVAEAARFFDGLTDERVGGEELEALKVIQKHVNKLLAGHQEPADDPMIVADLRDIVKALRPN